MPSEKELKVARELRNLVSDIQKIGADNLEVQKEEFENIKKIRDLTGMNLTQSKAYLQTQNKVRDIKKEISDLSKQEEIDNNAQVQAQQKILDAMQKRQEREKEIDGFFSTFKDKFDDFVAIAQDPKIAGGLWAMAAANSMKEFAGHVMTAKDQMGLTYGQSVGLAGTMGKAAISGFTMGVGFKEAGEAAAALSEAGMAFGDISADTVKTVAALNTQLGVSMQSGAKLFKTFKNVSGGSEESAKSMLKFTENLARGNKVAPGKVMEDMAQNTDAFAGYMKDGGKNISEAAVYAAKMGVSISTMTAMADNLLDIESSIEAEMEASVLLGKQINMNKARELAMSGDLAGSMQEVLNQVGGIAGWEKMNVVQRKAAAKAAGMELSEMQSIMGNREKQIEMGLVEATGREKIMNFIGGTGKSIKDNMALMSSTVNMVASLQQLKALGWIKEKMHWVWKKVVSGASWMKEKAFLIWSGVKKAAGWIAEKLHLGWVGSTKVAMFIKDKAAWLWMKGQKAAFWLAEKGHMMWKKAFGGGGDAAGAAGKGAAGAGKKLSKGLTGGGGDAGKSISSTGDATGGMGKNAKNILAGAAAMLIVAAALWVFGQALLLFAQVPWSAVAVAAVSLLLLVGAVAAIGAIMMSGVGAVAIIAGAAAMLIIAAAVLVFGLALMAMAQAIPILVEFIPQIPLLGLSFLGLLPIAFVAPMVAVGLILMAAGFAAFGIGMLYAAPGMFIASLLLPLLTPAIMSLSEIPLVQIGIGMGIFGMAMIPFGLGMLIAAPGMFLASILLPILLPALATGLTALSGLDLMSMGSGLIGLGIGMGLFGLSLIPFAIGMWFASTGLLLAALVFPIVFPALATGLQALAGADMATLGVGLAVLGLGLAGLAFGLVPFGVGMLLAAPGLFLASVILPLLMPTLSAGLATLAGIDLTSVAVGLGVLGLALIPFSLALGGFALGLFFFQLLGGFKKLERLSTAFASLKGVGAEIQLITPGVTALKEATSGMGTVASAFAKLGGAMAIAAVGFGLFNLFGGNTVLDALANSIPLIVPYAEGISVLGAAFGDLAFGLLKLAAAALLMLPALPVLAAIGAVGPTLGSLMGGGDKEEVEAEGEGDGTGNEAIIAKLDELIGVMKQGGVINMDGQKVGEIIGLAEPPASMR